MTILAASILIATAAPQGPVGPIGPIGPIIVPPGPIVLPRFVSINMIGNPGFEAASLSPWQTGGLVKYYDESADGLSTQLVSQSLAGYATPQAAHREKRSFRMNAEFPGYVLPGNEHSSDTFVRQTLSTTLLGSVIANASVWVLSGDELKVTIEYTSGPPTSKSAYFNKVWARWDFRSVIDPNRVVKAIQFDSHAPYFKNYGVNVGSTWIDDVDVSTLLRIS